MNHVHIGPSALAHGLLIPCTISAGFAVAVVGRISRRDSTEYIYVNTATGRRWPREVDLVEGPRNLPGASRELRGMVEDQDPLLLTCSLRGAIVERRDLVVELLKGRPRGAETVFAACENTPHATYREIEELCRAEGGVPLRTVVNRMCREEKERDAENRRVVLAHPLGEWVFEAPPRPMPLLDALARVDEVEVVEDYEARKARKIWMVNGVHVALALEARAAFLDSFEEDEWDAGRKEEGGASDLTELARRPEVIIQLSQLHGPMNEALMRTYPALTNNLEYGKKHVLAYMEHSDLAERVLSGFNRRNLAPFIETMEERLGEPARVCFKAGCSREAFEPVLDVFEDLVSDPGAFLDAEEVRKDRDLVSKAADERAVAAYERFLTGWMPVAAVEERVARFAESLFKSSPR
jgi:hypothetical protein